MDIILDDLFEQDSVPPRGERRGLVIVNTGNGKGKTSASLGVAFRALGWNWRIRIIQFFKGPWMTGEKRLCERLRIPIELYSLGEGFTWDVHNPLDTQSSTRPIWKFAQETIEQAEHDLVILDEINLALALQNLSIDAVLETLRNRPSWMHIICTGRNAPRELIAFADLVSDIRDVKHPYRMGVEAQQGIEF